MTSNFTSLTSDPTQIYVDKSITVRIIRLARRQFEPRVPVIRRPEGSGLRTFVSMVCEYHDYLSNASESGLFERLPAGQILEKTRDSIVLRFDLADPSIYTTSPFSQGLIDYIQRQMSAVEVKYRDVLLDYRPPLYSTSTKDHILFAFLDSLQGSSQFCAATMQSSHHLAFSARLPSISRTIHQRGELHSPVAARSRAGSCHSFRNSRLHPLFAARRPGYSQSA